MGRAGGITSARGFRGLFHAVLDLAFRPELDPMVEKAALSQWPQSNTNGETEGAKSSPPDSLHDP